MVFHFLIKMNLVCYFSHLAFCLVMIAPLCYNYCIKYYKGKYLCLNLW